jgi:predicted transcriptional regulator YheO
MVVLPEGPSSAGPLASAVSESEAADKRGRQSEPDRIFATLRPVIAGIADTFGRNCEVVLHDFRKPDGTIVGIAGNVTNRHVGGSVSQIGMAIIAEGDAAEDQYSYITRTPDGRVLKSVTITLRDSRSRVFGALCINYDVSDLQTVAAMLDDLTGSGRQTPRQIAFADDAGDVIAEVIREEEMSLGRSIDRNSKADRLEVIRGLERRGVFSMRRSVPQVADYLGVSRATLYSYLSDVRGRHDESNGGGS